jgi:hypothetical protein
MPLNAAPLLYFLRSGTSDEGKSLGIRIPPMQDSGVEAKLKPWEGGRPEELWWLLPGLLIQSSYNNFYLSAADSDGFPLITNYQPYSWNLTDDGLLLSTSGEYVLAVTEGTMHPQLVMRPKASYKGNRWQLLPNVWTPQSGSNFGSIQSKLTPNGPFRNPMGLNIDGGHPVPGSGVILWPLSDGGTNQLWKLTDDGHILSALGGGLVLDSGANAEAGTQVIVNPWSVPSAKSQQWSVKDGVITNAATELVVNVSGANTAPGTSIVLWELESGSQSDNEIFFFNVPRQPLSAIMRLPPTPFPSFSALSFGADGEKAYQYINSQLHLGAGEDPPLPPLRANYSNLDLGSLMPDWLMKINSLSPPSDVSQESWDAVVAQLTGELNAVPVVQTLFANTIEYLQGSIANNEATYSQIVDLLSLPDQLNQKALSWIGSLVEGLVYTVVSAVPVASGVNLWSVAANLMSTVYSTVMASAGANPPPADAFQVAYAELWGTISANFESMVGTTGAIATSILADWGKIQATYEKCLKPGPDGLAWPPSLTSVLIDQSATAFATYALQVLLPIQNQIYMIPAGVDKEPGPSSWQDTSGNTYFLASNSDWSSSPADQVFEYLSNNVSLQDMYLSLSGWTLPVAVIGGIKNDDQTNVSISNQSGKVLTLGVSSNEGLRNCSPAIFHDYRRGTDGRVWQSTSSVF